tara:strand:- start:481 stop:669 length:189 start_codon:yes stop_codon:yes gene_type:complete
MSAPVYVDYVDAQILEMWRGGDDTCQISKNLWLPEANIANRLPRILEIARQDQEWNFDRIAR